MNPANYLPVPAKGQVVSVTTTSAQSSAFAASTFAAWVTADTSGVFIEVGSDPTATTTTSMYLTKDWPYFLKVPHGGKIAAIVASSTANLYISEATQ